MLINEIITIRLAEAEQRQRVSAIPIPDPVKHERIVRALTAQITRAANQQRPTPQDLALASERYEQAQKRANLAYKEAQAASARKLKAQKAARQRLRQLGLPNYKV